MSALDPTRSVRAPARPDAGSQPRRRSQDWRWWVLAVILTLWAAVPLAVAVLHVVSHGGAITGTDSALAGADQQQYLAAIRESGQHLLILNPFRIGTSTAVYLNPMYLISGLLWRIGLDLRATLLLWTPVAAALIAFGVTAYVSRLLAPRQRLAAVVLALFYFSPVLPGLVWSGVHLSAHVRAALLLTSGEAMPAWQLWGYVHTVIVLGLMPLCLLAVERALRAHQAGEARSAWLHLGWGSAAGCVIGWLHPWQGIVLLAILAGLAAWGRLERRYRLLSVPALATAAPMVYLYVLSRTNPDWRLFSLQNRAFHDPAWVLLAALVPLLLPALAGARGERVDEQERMLLLWPVACIVVYLGVHEFPFHALQGISIPLSVLAVRGYGRFRTPRLAGMACVTLLSVPGILFQLDTFRSNVEHKWAPYWLAAGERSALDYLNHAPAGGGVLSRYYLGMTVPAFTGREVWVGHYVWTPDFGRRVALTERLFNGSIPPAATQAIVRSTRASYLLSDCQSRVDMGPILGGLLISSHRFGCASVYRVRP